MNDKLTIHAQLLLTSLLTGKKAYEARNYANNISPPRDWNNYSQGINWMKKRLIKIYLGDEDATLKGVYLARTEDSSQAVQVGNLVILFVAGAQQVGSN